MPELLVSELELDEVDGLLDEVEELGLEELLELGFEALLEPLIELPLVLPVDAPAEEPLFRLLALPEDDELTLSAVRVWSSIWPEALRPFCCWNFFSAALVLGPSMPSTGPALKPWSFRACWTCDTFELSFADDEDDCDEEEDGAEDCDDEDDGEEDCDELIAGVWL